MLTAQMFHTFTALLLAQTLARYVFQSRWMQENPRDLRSLGLTGGIVFVLSIAALGGGWRIALYAALLHLLIDAAQRFEPPALAKTAGAHLAYLIAHIGAIAGLAYLYPDTTAAGLWAQHTGLLLAPALILSGFLISTLAGGQIVALLTARFVPQVQNTADDSLPDAGRMIGQLERTLIFLLICVDQPAGIGFLIAAKSILRFEAGNKLQASEYVIIGTLASFAWALALGYATFALLEIARNLP